MPSTPQYFIHIGLPKTATTTLQDNVFFHHPGVNYLGKPCNRPDVDRSLQGPTSELITRIWHTPPEEDCDATLQDLRDRGVTPQETPDKPNVMSAEELSYSTPQRILVPKRLAKLFPQARILLTTRSQLTSLPSAYFWKYLNFEINTSFDNWFDKMVRHSSEPPNRINQPLNLPRFGTLMKAYAEEFGAENILILPLEILSRDSELFARTLGDFMGIDATRIHELLGTGRRNTRMSLPAIKYQRFIKKSLARFMPKRLRRRTNVLHGVHKWGLNGFITRRLNRKPVASLELNEQQNRFIHDFYSPENRMIAETYDVDLAKYGYPM